MQDRKKSRAHASHPVDKAGGQDTKQSRLVYGFHAVLGQLRRAPDRVFEVYLSEQRHDIRSAKVEQLCAEQKVRCIQYEAQRLDQMVGTRRHQGVVARVDGRRTEIRLEDILETLEPPALLLVLDGVQDPHNLGACLRVADAVGAHAVIAPKDRAVGLNATAIKVASGAADAIPYITVTNLARSLRQMQDAGVWIIGATDDAPQSLYEVDLCQPVAWVLGAEGSGLRRLTRDVCDTLAFIPMLGSVESLNVSVATGVCLYEARRQRLAAALRQPAAD